MVRVGLDIGGTKTAAMVVDAAGRCLSLLARPTDVVCPERLVAGVVAAVDSVLAEAGATRTDVAAVGVGVPGQVDPAAGTVTLAVNLNLRQPYPLGDALRAALGAPVMTPVALENDVRAAAWGAFHWVNERRPLNSLAYLSIGTGIAAGLVLDGRLYRGANGMAGEVGHIPVDPAGPRCRCGAYGCLEVYAAGPAIAAQAGTTADGRPPTTAEVYSLAASGQPAARAVVERAAGYLARAVYLLAMTYDVERVVLGGGVTRGGAAFEQPLRHALAALRADSALAASMLPDDKIIVLPADLNAGVMGAVRLPTL